jgi:hypothetical protein
VLVLRASLNPEGNPRTSCARDVLSPSFRARIGPFASAAATKCVSRRDDGPTPRATRFHSEYILYPEIYQSCTPEKFIGLIIGFIGLIIGFIGLIIWFIGLIIGFIGLIIGFIGLII